MNDSTLILAVAELSSAAPRQWAAFLEQLKAYSDRKRDEMVRAPLEQIQVAQGRAQQAGQFYDLARDCRVNAEKVLKGR